jgi:hypothetical protein
LGEKSRDLKKFFTKRLLDHLTNTPLTKLYIPGQIPDVLKSVLPRNRMCPDFFVIMHKGNPSNHPMTKQKPPRKLGGSGPSGET